MKKMCGDIIILHMCTKIYDQIYGSWDVVHDGRTDEETEKVTQIEVSVPSKKLN